MILPMVTVAAEISPGKAVAAAVSAAVKPSAVTRGGAGRLIITLNIAPGYVVTAHQETDPDAIKAMVSPAPLPGVVYGTARYPTAHIASVGGQREKVYTGRTVIIVPFTVTASAKRGQAKLGASVTYQSCSQISGSCLPPRTVSVSASASVK